MTKKPRRTPSGNEIVVRLTWRQAERVMVDAENVASFSDEPSVAREMAQIAARFKKAFDAAMKSTRKEAKP
jgi:hypothetical protein